MDKDDSGWAEGMYTTLYRLGELLTECRTIQIGMTDTLVFFALAIDRHSGVNVFASGKSLEELVEKLYLSTR